MTADLAAANVNRSYQLAASSIAIFTFLLFFLYPKFVSGDVHALPFQAALIVMGVATFSFGFASFYYYGGSLADRFDEAERIRLCHRGDHVWLLGCVLLFLTPTLILVTVRLFAVASAVVRPLACLSLLRDQQFLPRPDRTEEVSWQCPVLRWRCCAMLGDVGTIRLTRRQSKGAHDREHCEHSGLMG